MKGVLVLFAVATLVATVACAAQVPQKPTAAPPAAPAATTTKKPWTKPAFCNDLECPVFEEIRQHPAGAYKVRKYVKSSWATTTVIDMDYRTGVSIGFGRLFSYISGAGNDKGQVIAMTAPVLTKVTPGQGPNCESNFTVSFLLPAENQADPPKPSSKDVYIHSYPEMTVYTRSFSGYASGEDYLENIQEMAAAIGDISKVTTSHYYTAGYDSPYKWWDRHNEVWLEEVQK